MSIRIFLSVSLLLVSIAAFSQTKKASLKIANEKFLASNYEAALQDYLILLPEDPSNAKTNYRIGVCYLNTNLNKIKAISYLENASKAATPEPNALYLLARAYHFANRFDDAIKTYTAFKKAGKGSEQNIKDTDREIEACLTAKELIKFPLNVTFENLGKNINSAYADEFPFVPKNESFILYNSRRDDGNIQGADGKYFSDVYIATETGGKWQKSKSLSSEINTNEGDEQIIGLSADGTTALFYFDNNVSQSNILIAKYDGTSFSKPKALPEVINSKYNEIAAALSNDGNSIYFASDRPGGYGGIDLYVSRILPNGGWGPAENLGAAINTPFDEDFPTFSTDGKSLLFSSKGHATMGGYDIFKASLDEQTQKFGSVKNIGYPINSAGDDFNLSLTENGRNGYMSNLREGGQGDLDIFRIIFNEVDPSYTIIKGKLLSSDALKPISNAAITVTDKSNGEIFGSYLPNPNNMHYVMILPPGKYKLEIEADGFKTFSEDIDIADKSSFIPMIERDVTLSGK